MYPISGSLMFALRSGDEELRAWLGSHQPEAGEGRAAWWEGAILSAQQCAYQAVQDTDRWEFTRLALSITDEAIRQGVLSERDGLVRMANQLAFLVAEADSATNPLDVDSVVVRCLDAIDVSYDDAMNESQDWPSLPADRIMALRVAKTLLTPCERLSGRVRNPGLRQRLATWLELLPNLP